MTRAFVYPAAFLLTSAALVGCGPGGPARQELEGTVTYHGQPVANGTITFDPDTEKGHEGMQGTAQITDGRYKTNPKFGPAPGPHLARVTGYDGKTVGPDAVPLFSDVQIPVEVPAGGGTLDLVVPDQPKPAHPKK